jgi:diguanylate cyclase (GGDEF)-like protein/putative nucleotidyltransferase with HDIG domain
LDIDNFQMLNSTYGHPVGDRLLKLVAGSIEKVVAPETIVGRFGSDEFVVILTNANVDDAVEVVSRVNELLRAQEFMPYDDNRRIPLSVTCGIANYPQDSDSYDELLTTVLRNLVNAQLSGSQIGCTTDIQRMGKTLQSESSFSILDMLVTAVDNKDSYTRRHSEQVAEFSMWICEELGVDEVVSQCVQKTALLHDVGKIGVPQEILSKPGRLTDSECENIERHCWLGATLLGAFPDVQDLVPGVKSHHERWDGSGYPEHLQSTEIPWSARVLAVADSFSAMTTSRVYRQALEWDVALSELRANAGRQFDPDIVEAFLRAAKRKHVELPSEVGKAA